MYQSQETIAYQGRNDTLKKSKPQNKSPIRHKKKNDKTRPGNDKSQEKKHITLRSLVLDQVLVNPVGLDVYLFLVWLDGILREEPSWLI